MSKAKKSPFHQKIKEYLQDNGIQHTWFAAKLGLSHQQFYQITTGYVKLPKKYWSKIILLTGRKITLRDLMEQHLRSPEGLEIKEGPTPHICEITLLDDNA